MKIPLLKRVYQKSDRNKLRRIRFVMCGILINVFFSFIMYRLGLPLFLDTIGTIGVAVICGSFPGVITAAATNVICSLFNPNAIYFICINTLIAIYSVWYIKKISFRSPAKVLVFALTVILFSGFSSAIIQWGLLGEAQQSLVDETARAIALATGLSYFPAFTVTSILLNILDKGFTVVLIFFVMRLLPEKEKQGIELGSWRQHPLSDQEIKAVKEWTGDVKYSAQKRTMRMLVVTSIVLISVLSWTALRLYYEDAKRERIEMAHKTLKLAAGMIDTDRVEDYIRDRKSAAGFEDTRKKLIEIRETYTDTGRLYAFRIEDAGCRYIMDVDGNSEKDFSGALVPFEEEELIRNSLPKLQAGEQVEMENASSIMGTMLTIYYPVKDENGNTVFYMGMDVRIKYLQDYWKKFILKIFLILIGFFIAIISYGKWMTKTYIDYPISSMSFCVDQFARTEESQEKMDENVKAIRALDIHTGDEVEKLYQAICKMTLDQAEKFRDVRRLSESTAKMQDGLIITMADMVESRDSDTGAHVQKTAAYVKIIVEGLRKKGYYAEKITPKFIADVVRSAPLHDVGKINISDKILNKPGKLTDEEYEIMKTHTTAGKKIMENAIQTVQGENYLKEARNMAAYHHERWDGKGYPEGLCGEVIPLSARIMAVADVFDALSSPRVYKPAFPLEKALSIMQEGAGSQFDPKCIEVFLEALPEVKVILRKYNQNMRGEVDRVDAR